jgi:glycosyltransferase involved in cell wall biosynthesis
MTAAAPLRVAQVIRSVASDFGGPSVSVPSLCEALAAQRHQVRLHVVDARKPAVPLERTQFVPHACVPGGRAWGASWQLHRALVRESRELDIVHSHGLWLFPNLDVAWATRGARAKHVLSPRGMLESYSLQRRKVPKRVLWRLGQAKAVERAACVHVTSESEAQSVRTLGLRNPVAVIPNGVAIPAAAARFAGPRRQLLYVGRLDEKKGVDFLLQAWARVADAFPEWDLHIVGPGSPAYVTFLKALAQERGAARVQFEGPAYGAERDARLSAADLFVLPTRSENFGMSVAEALAAGVPVICSRGAPWPALEEQRCGFWIDIGAEPLEACLRVALGLARETLSAMGERGRVWMQRSYSWDAQARKTADVYTWLLGRGARPSFVHLD